MNHNFQEVILFLMLLGSDIEIVVKDNPRNKAGHMKVAMA